MLDTDYPHFPHQSSDAPPRLAAGPVANLTGFAGCQLLLLAKKCAESIANFSVSRPKNPLCTPLPRSGVLSRGASTDEILG